MGVVGQCPTMRDALRQKKLPAPTPTIAVDSSHPAETCSSAALSSGRSLRSTGLTSAVRPLNSTCTSAAASSSVRAGRGQQVLITIKPPEINRRQLVHVLPVLFSTHDENANPIEARGSGKGMATERQDCAANGGEVELIAIRLAALLDCGPPSSSDVGAVLGHNRLRLTELDDQQKLTAATGDFEDMHRPAL